MKSSAICVSLALWLTSCFCLPALSGEGETTAQGGQVLGQYLKPAENQTSVVLSRPSETTPWVQLTPGQSVKAGQTYLALPGCRGELQLGSVALTLVGMLPEIMPRPQLLESVIDLHQNETAAVELTLQRGRVMVISQAEKSTVRVRFENPSFADRSESIDLILEGKGTQILLDRGGLLRPGKHFFKDPKDPARDPTGAFLGIWVLKGNASARHDSITYSLSAPPGRAKLIWNSLRGLNTPENVPELPSIISANPPLPEELDTSRRTLRDQIFKARDDLGREPPAKPIMVRLLVASKSSDVARRIMAIRCYAALGSMPRLVECLLEAGEPRCWLAAVAGAKHWMAVSRDNEYQLFDALCQRFTNGEALKIMELFHGLGKPDALVEFLDNPCLTIRQLSHLNLCEVVPAGKEIRYDPTMPANQREAAQREWHKLLHPKLEVRNQESGGRNQEIKVFSVLSVSLIANSIYALTENVNDTGHRENYWFLTPDP